MKSLKVYYFLVISLKPFHKTCDTKQLEIALVYLHVKSHTRVNLYLGLHINTRFFSYRNSKI